jgi:hypothetical protein
MPGIAQNDKPIPSHEDNILSIPSTIIYLTHTRVGQVKLEAPLDED